MSLILTFKQNCYIEAKKAKQSDEKARAEAERCRKMSNQAIKEHATMKEHYTNNLNKLKWTENKLQAESEALGKIKLKHQMVSIN